MTTRPLAEALERRQLMAVDVTVPQVDLTEDSNLLVQSLAGSGDGESSFVTAWSDRNPSTGLGNEVFVRFTSFGVSSASQQVNTTTAGVQQNVDVATGRIGGLSVVTWQSAGQDGSGYGIYFRVVDATGTFGSAELIANQTTAGDQTVPRVAVAADGTFVIAWRSVNSIVARRFSFDGTTLGSEFTVASGAGEVYSAPDVAMRTDGSFAIAYTRALTSGGDTSTDVQMRIYDATGTLVDATVPVSAAGAAGNQAEPSIAVAGTYYVVAWSDDSAGDAQIFFRALYATAQSSGSTVATLASQDSDGDRSRPQVTGDAVGNFTVGWTRQESGAFYSTADFRSFNANFSATSNETPIGDGSSNRTLSGLVQTGQGTFRDVSTVGEFLGYGVPIGATFANVIDLDGTSAADTLVAYDLNSTTIRTTANGTRRDYLRSAYAYIRSALGDGNDRFDGGGVTVPVTLDGGLGDDTLLGGGGRDAIAGGDGADSINAGAGDDYAIGNSGDDSILGGDGVDTLTGSAGRNRLYGGNGNDRLSGSGGRDFLYGEAGDDRLYGAAGNDYLDGGGNVDRIWAGDGDDSLIGGSAIDRLYGENGNDTFVGGPGNDYLFGGAGNDTTRPADAGDILDSVEVSV